MRLIDVIDTYESKESTLIDSFENYLIQSSAKKHSALIREMDCWQGRADVVAVYINNGWNLPEGAANVISRLGPAQLLAVLYPKKKQKYADIVTLSGLSESTVRRHLKELIEAGLIQKFETDLYTLHPEIVLPNVTFHAYEGKLHNWKRALYQAINYLGFAQYSSIVMPERYIKTALENIDHFKINGIGIISVSNQKYKIHLKPRKNRPRKKSFHLVGIGKAISNIINQSNISNSSEEAYSRLPGI
ncbi:ArsR family transcriptional regulator [Paenibacillus alginolyticus]|uniref:Helix-turn-helix domain-containing protein n=1 Tax=Paenibacillus alginolyticus TaxID=59839 RepID=A0ABT4G7X2_9BACL|nr:helix-turn-helix domain-containing protein [Paenibacillus alginolyticus]MCY9692272.1 helix-turn-helix domain-containing protein [Paenibacillus alginolyticus]MEC0145886.1 helix-turn-helix domain-containing protein [Paenibacillus alginolyticus]